MKTEEKILDEIRRANILKKSAHSIDEPLQDVKIKILEWVLRCEECKMYPCICYEPF